MPGLLRSLVHNSPDIITVVAPDATIQYQSPAVQRLLGYHPAELVGTSLGDLVHPDDAPRMLALLDYAQDWPGDSPPVEARMRHRGGAWLDTETTASSLLDDPNVRGAVLTTRDATIQRALAELLKHQASRDSLTNLPNRALFRDRLEQALARARRGEGSVGVLFLDLDNFKGLNDSLGHQTVDRLLVAVAERLRACVWPQDTVARVGGDEFTVLLEHVAGVSDAVEIARRISERLRRVFSVGGDKVFTTASIGIALSRPGQDRPDDLLRVADAAMYRAKSQGKDRHEVFDRSIAADQGPPTA